MMEFVIDDNGRKLYKFDIKFGVYISEFELSLLKASFLDLDAEFSVDGMTFYDHLDLLGKNLFNSYVYKMARTFIEDYGREKYESLKFEDVK